MSPPVLFRSTRFLVVDKEGEEDLERGEGKNGIAILNVDDYLDCFF